MQPRDLHQVTLVTTLHHDEMQHIPHVEGVVVHLIIHQQLRAFKIPTSNPYIILLITEDRESTLMGF